MAAQKVRSEYDAGENILFVEDDHEIATTGAEAVAAIERMKAAQPSA